MSASADSRCDCCERSVSYFVCSVAHHLVELAPVGLTVGDNLRAALLELARDALQLADAPAARGEELLGAQPLLVRGRQLPRGDHRGLPGLQEIGVHGGELCGRGARRLASLHQFALPWRPAGLMAAAPASRT